MKLRPHERLALQLIETGRATSQIQLSRALRLRPNTVHGLMKRLEGERLVRRLRSVGLGRGRPPIRYGPPTRGPVLAIDWVGTVWVAGVFDSGEKRGDLQRRESPPIANLREALRVLRGLRDAALDGAGLRPDQLTGAVLNLNARHLPEDRGFLSSVIPWIQDASERDFSRALGCAVHLEPECLRVLPELRARAAEGVNRIVVLNVGDGVSANGAGADPVWGTEHSFPGELGHVVVEPGGPRCGCGHRGCLEAFISGPALIRRVQRDLRAGVSTRLADAARGSPSVLFARIEEEGRKGGDPYAFSLAEEFLGRVAWGASVAMNLFDPDVLVLGGYALEGREEWRRRILVEARRLSASSKSDTLRMEFPRVTPEEHLCALARPFRNWRQPPRPSIATCGIRRTGSTGPGLPMRPHGRRVA